MIPGGDWRAEITLDDGSLHDTPVLCWVRTPLGMGPVIVLPGDCCATALTAEPGSSFLAARRFKGMRLYTQEAWTTSVPQQATAGPQDYVLDGNSR